MSNKIWPLLPSVVAALVAATATTLQPATSALAHAPLRSPAVLTAPQAADADLAGLLAHTEQPGLPGYTAAGAAAGMRSNLFFPTDDGAQASIDEAISGLVDDAPLHRYWMLSPRLKTVDVATEGGWWVIDLGD